MGDADAIFEALSSSERLMDEKSRPALAALLRNHMLPVLVSPEDMLAAIERAGDGSVTVRTLGSTVLEFSRTGSQVTIHAPDGSTAQVAAKPIEAGASIALPLDGLLQKV